MKLIKITPQEVIEWVKLQKDDKTYHYFNDWKDYDEDEDLCLLSQFSQCKFNNQTVTVNKLGEVWGWPCGLISTIDFHSTFWEPFSPESLYNLQLTKTQVIDRLKEIS